ncbi:MAG: NADH:ubiquinone oxidoreductase subunit A [Bacteroidetes bacterium]|nr:MAG: NADH:ubiquinone oxidoreductase subunit A [Bacteroidota bacterium]
MILLKQTIYFWPFLVYAGIAFAIAGIMIGLSYILGERHKEKTTDEPYESGIPGTGNARLRFSSHFYIIAMFFVIFDLDAAFIFAWAISFRELGIPGYLGVLVFILILVVVLIYELGIGALNFGPDGKKILKVRNKLK